MTETTEIAAVFNKEFYRETLILSPTRKYIYCSIDECDVFIGSRDFMPEICHIENCTIHLRPGLSFRDFIHGIAGVNNGRVYNRTSSGKEFSTGNKGKNPNGNYWCNSSVVSEGIEREMIEVAEEWYKDYYKKVNGVDYNALAWWEAN